MVTGLLIVSLLACAWLAWMVARQRRALVLLGREWKELQTEEERVFDFLHGLGEAFGGGAKRRELHRLIVESAARILDAHGGAFRSRFEVEASLVALQREGFLFPVQPDERGGIWAVPDELASCI
ncbi:MAG: hypothetical protein ACO3XN_05175, partial [Chthoniobacterales bacterium]